MYFKFPDPALAFGIALKLISICILLHQLDSTMVLTYNELTIRQKMLAISFQCDCDCKNNESSGIEPAYLAGLSSKKPWGVVIRLNVTKMVLLTDRG